MRLSIVKIGVWENWRQALGSYKTLAVVLLCICGGLAVHWLLPSSLFGVASERQISRGQRLYWEGKTMLIAYAAGREEIAKTYSKFCQTRGLVVGLKKLERIDVNFPSFTHPNEVFNVRPDQLPFMALRVDLVDGFFSPNEAATKNNKQMELLGWDVLVVFHALKQTAITQSVGVKSKS